MIFLLLFVATDYRGKDTIPVAVNGFFRADPLVAFTYLLSTRSFTILLLPGFVLILFTALLGRFFCGWVCPLGTIVDLVPARFRKGPEIRLLKGRARYYVLLTLLFSALFGLNVAGLVDPIAILLRGLTFVLYPLLGDGARQAWTSLYALLGDKRDYLDGAYGFLRGHALPFRQTLYPLGLLSLLALSGVVLLERWEERNWCRNLCPLGTLLGLASRFSLLRRLPSRLCKDCGECRRICPTSFDTEILHTQDCILCMRCVRECDERRPAFVVTLPTRRHKGFSAGRRALVGGVVSGFFLSRLFQFDLLHPSLRLLRPPGAEEEAAFMKKCIRCGECIKVCPRNGLYPTSLQAGLAGLYTPVLVPRLGYCEYHCTLCGQVCPTGAIRNLYEAEKLKTVIGLAVIDRNVCLPYSRRVNCMVCEEHCPIPDKAIRFEEVADTDYSGKKISLKKPYVVEEACTGCGICEYVCPLGEKAGIEIFPLKGKGSSRTAT